MSVKVPSEARTGGATYRVRGREPATNFFWRFSMKKIFRSPCIEQNPPPAPEPAVQRRSLLCETAIAATATLPPVVC